MKIETKILTELKLDWAVAKSEGLILYKDEILNGVKMEGWHASGYYKDANRWLPLWMLRYSTDWEIGGPIIEREKICVMSSSTGDFWDARLHTFPPEYVRGPTPLIAAMRCYVLSRLGPEVDMLEKIN